MGKRLLALLLPVLFSLVLVSGCLEKTEVIPAEKESILNYSEGDSNGDGVVDWHLFFFKPENVTPEITIKRSLLVTGVAEQKTAGLNLTEAFTLDHGKLSEVRVVLKEFNSSRASPTPFGPAELACREKTRFASQPCASLSECRSACLSSNECSAAISLYGDAFASSILDFQENSLSLDGALDDAFKSLDQAESQPALDSLNKVISAFEKTNSLATSISTSPLFSENGFHYCTPVPLAFNLLQDARKKFIASINTSGNVSAPEPKPPEKYDVFVRVSLFLSEGAAFSDLTVIEIIPRELASRLDDVKFSLNYSQASQKPPFVVTWKTSNVGGGSGEREFAYLIGEVAPPPEGWNEFAQTLSKPQLSVTRVDPSASPLAVSILGAYYGVFSIILAYTNYYVATSVSWVLSLVAAWLAWSALSLVFHLVNSVKNRKTLAQALYDFAGHGGTQASAYLALAIGLSLLGLLLIYLTGPMPPEASLSANPVQALGADYAKLLGAISLFLGLLSLYFLVSDIAKGAVLGKKYYEKPLPTGLRAVMYESQIIEACREMRSQLELLLEKTRAPAKDGFLFGLEEKNAHAVLASLDASESACKAGDLAQANITLQSAKSSFEKTKTELEAKLEKQRLITENLAQLQKAGKLLSEKVAYAKKLGVPAVEERSFLKRLDSDAAVRDARAAWRSDDLEKASSILQASLQSFQNAVQAVSLKTEEREALLGRTFRCLECGKSMSVVSSVCPYCKSDVAEKIKEKVKELKANIASYLSEIEPAKDLFSFSSEEKILGEIQASFQEILDFASRKEFDDAIKALEAEATRFDKAEPTLKDKIEAFKGFSERRGILEKRIDVLKHMLSQAEKLGIDLSAEEKQFKEIELDQSLSEVRSQFKNGKFSSADELMTTIENRYEHLELAVGDLIEEFRNQADKIAQMNAHLTRSEELISTAKKLGLDFSQEQQQLQHIDEAQLKASLKQRLPVATGINSALSTASQVEKALEEKIALFGAISEKIAYLAKVYAESESLLNKCLSENIDVGAEHEKLYSIDLALLRSQAASLAEPDKLHKSLARAQSSASSSISSLKEKLATLDNWDSWSTHIASLLRRQDKITESMLVSIPEKWRKWSMERYLAEHPAESFVMEENSLVRLTPAPVSKFQFEAILQRLVSSQRIEAAAVVRRDGLMVSSNLPKEIDSELIAAMASRTSSKAETVSAELKKGAAKDIIISTERGRLVIVSAGRMALLIVLIKPGEDMGFTLISMNEAAKEVAKLLEGKT